MIRWLYRTPSRLLTEAITWLVRGYQYLIRPLLPPVCRFEPGCSDYMILACQKYGPIIGAAKGTWRLCRCNPLFPGGYDPP